MRKILGVLALVAVVGSAHAADKDKGKKKEPAAPTANDFFGDMGDAKKKKPAEDDLGSALKGVKTQEAPKEDLGPRGSMAEGASTVTLKGLFVAPQIMVTGQGCVPPKPGQNVTKIEATDYPFILQPFSVCAHLESARGRAVQVTYKIVTPLGRVVGRSEQRVDFTGRTQVDNVVDFPEMSFPVEGKYFYRMEMEGALMGQVELFELVTRPKTPPPPSVNDLVNP